MKWDFVFISVLLVLLTVGLALGQGDQAKSAPPPMLPADAAQLWTYIAVTNPYQGWAIWPGEEEVVPGVSPHGAFVRIYANAIAMKSLREGKTQLPDGAVLVKANYGKDKTTFLGLTPMVKIKGYNPDAGDWFWVSYSPDGKATAEGKVKSCIGCHEAVGSHDWYFTKYETPAKAGQ